MLRNLTAAIVRVYMAVQHVLLRYDRWRCQPFKLVVVEPPADLFTAPATTNAASIRQSCFQQTTVSSLQVHHFSDAPLSRPLGCVQSPAGGGGGAGPAGGGAASAQRSEQWSVREMMDLK